MSGDSLPDIINFPSPNCGPRRGGQLPDMVVLHYTAMTTATAALERLCDPMAEVSCHYLICERGRVWRMVEENQRAWHAGAGQWGGVRDVNSRSVGIELANTGIAPFPEPQMMALERLLRGIMQRWAILPERVIGHSDMAPVRKVDPGSRFDWRRLALGGLSVWPDPVADGGDPAQFRAQAQAFGYSADVADDALLAAFRLRFRPWAEGPLDAVDIGMIQNLSARFPVDQSEPTA